MEITQALSCVLREEAAVTSPSVSHELVSFASHQQNDSTED